MLQEKFPFELPVLSYATNALEPVIDQTTMEIHHGKHHQAYVTNLNNALKDTAGASVDLAGLLANISQYSPAVRNNGGGHYNHSLFWSLLIPAAGQVPAGTLLTALESRWGSIADFKEAFAKEALQRFGSGWVWLIVKPNQSLEITSTPNQDNPLMDINTTNRGIPILALDVWEHAYYLKYQNKRADYVAKFWEVVNWEAVTSLYENAVK
ncbi:superoxide dismutase [Chitinophaga nivalis]|uniref:Superoxide dismutase n=1 Tax=Chitinophaga nivalis TaxID=2991709 RepID=A0ABT3IGR5_9BACT|nr:superoxide dismutase [Chitinophaga nivalis]MCW3467166.1 superoxide dismutase [Chitinophaga nivalis]MCW3483142.1 superoxide dismutase [Chitinophaga nivalis]